MEQDISQLSSHYKIKQFTKEDIPEIYALCKGNPIYYKYMNLEPTIENITEVLTSLPPGKTMKDKYFVGFYLDTQLIAILDLICGYPTSDTVFLGWFMMNQSYQGTGIGTEIITELLAFFNKEYFKYVRLGYIKGNSQSEHFWLKNNFLPTGEESVTDKYTIIILQKKLKLLYNNPL